MVPYGDPGNFYFPMNTLKSGYLARGAEMQELLSSLITTEALVKEVHWNSMGPGFIALHEYLDRVYDDCEYYIDALAEHMSANATYPLPQWELRSFGTFPQSVVKTEPRSVHRGILEVAEYLTDLTEQLDEWLVESNDDQPGQDIVSAALAVFTKHLWMLSNELE